MKTPTRDVSIIQIAQDPVCDSGHKGKSPPASQSKGYASNAIEAVPLHANQFLSFSRAILEKKAMRIYEGDYAYEVERVLDPATLVPTGWKYNVYRVRPVNQFLHSGSAGSREEAELDGRRAVQHAIRQEGHKSAA